MSFIRLGSVILFYCLVHTTASEVTVCKWRNITVTCTSLISEYMSEYDPMARCMVRVFQHCDCTHDRSPLDSLSFLRECRFGKARIRMQNVDCDAQVGCCPSWSDWTSCEKQYRQRHRTCNCPSGVISNETSYYVESVLYGSAICYHHLKCQRKLKKFSLVSWFRELFNSGDIKSPWLKMPLTTILTIVIFFILILLVMGSICGIIYRRRRQRRQCREINEAPVYVGFMEGDREGSSSAPSNARLPRRLNRWIEIAGQQQPASSTQANTGAGRRDDQKQERFDGIVHNMAPPSYNHVTSNIRPTAPPPPYL